MTERKYELIISIVKRGYSDFVVDAARDAGATGGTIIHGRGTGSPEIEKFFGITISPEKEIVIILVGQNIKENVLRAINKAAGLETKGMGIAFTMPVSDVVGLASDDID